MKPNRTQNSPVIVHGQGQSLSRKLLWLLEIEVATEAAFGPLCPLNRGMGQFVPESHLTLTFVSGSGYWKQFGVEVLQASGGGSI